MLLKNALKSPKSPPIVWSSKQSCKCTEPQNYRCQAIIMQSHMAGMLCGICFTMPSGIGHWSCHTASIMVIPYLRHGNYCLVRHFPAIRMAGYQCLMPMASLVLETSRQTPHSEDAARGTGGTAGLRQIQTFQDKMGQIMVKVLCYRF